MQTFDEDSISKLIILETIRLSNIFDIVNIGYSFLVR